MEIINGERLVLGTCYYPEHWDESLWRDDLKRMLENNNEVLMQMFSREMSFLLDAKERQEEEQFKKIDQLIRQQQSYRKAAAEAGPIGKLKRLFLPA